CERISMATFVRLDEDAAFLEQRVKRFHAVRERVLEQVRSVIVGQDEVLDQILIALFVGGHCLLTGMPGTAKTLMVRTIAEVLGLAFRRIQFTPDLMPLRFRGNEVILFQVLDPQEIRPALKEPAIIVDLETNHRIEVIPEYTKSAYRTKIDAHVEQLRSRTRAAGMDYHLLVTIQPLDLALREYLTLRQTGD